jgi:hypothetical protein
MAAHLSQDILQITEPLESVFVNANAILATIISLSW